MKRKRALSGALHILLCSVLLCGCSQKVSGPVWEENVSSDLETVSWTDKEEVESDRIERTTSEAEEIQTIYVHVCGNVQNPGVYELPERAHVMDAVEAAGGFTEQASESAINLAQSVQDEMQIYVPSIEEAQGSGVYSEGKQTDGRININTADISQLCTLPGVGESKAKSIIAYRQEHGPFEKPEDIMKIPGIKEAGFAKMKDDIRLK